MSGLIDSLHDFKKDVPDAIKCILGSILFYAAILMHSHSIAWGNCFLATLCWVVSAFYWVCLVAPATCREIGQWVHMAASVLLFTLVIHGIAFGGNADIVAIFFMAGLLSTWRIFRKYEPFRTR